MSAEQRSRHRFGSVIGLRPEHEQAYREMHTVVWPAVLAQISRCNIRNYSIFLHNGLLFSYFEYVGDDFDGDMASMAADPQTQRWWDVIQPMQQQLDGTPGGEWWLPIAEVFHVD